MIIRFKNEEEYQKWISWQSSNVKEKARKFREVYGDIIPLILAVEADTSQTGEASTAHIFVHPEVQELLKWIVVGD